MAGKDFNDGYDDPGYDEPEFDETEFDESDYDDSDYEDSEYDELLLDAEEFFFHARLCCRRILE